MSDAKSAALSRRAHILVVDDEPGLLRAVERVLGHEHHVVTCGSAAAAIELSQQHSFDLVLSDISMPGIDGFAMMQQLRAARPGMDVILMTGMADQDATLVRAIHAGAFYFLQKPFNREVLKALVSRCAELRWLRESRRHSQARIARELTEGRRLQHAILRPGRLELNDLTLCARLEPSSELAGDLFDYAVLPDGQLAFLIADISGHGVSAAMLTAGIIAAFRGAASELFHPMAVLRAAHAQLQAFPNERFVTLFTGRIDVTTGIIDYVNAGHPPGFLIRAGGDIQNLDAGGPVVSATFSLDEWEICQAQAGLGDKLLIYTDGLTEAGEVGRMYGQDRLRNRAAEFAANSSDPDVVLNRLFEDVRSYSNGIFKDDLTAMMLCLKCDPPSGR